MNERTCLHEGARHHGRTARGLTMLGVLTAWLTTAAAHDTWLMPDRFALVPGQALTVVLSSGDGLKPGVVPRQSTLDSLRLVTAGGAVAPASWQRGRHSATARFANVGAQTPGLACLASSAEVSELRLRPEVVEKYLKEIHPPASVQAAWAAQRERGEPWIERYAKDAKTCLRVGDDDAGWPALASLGQGLEFVPQADPTRLSAGDTLILQLMRDGQPVPDVAVRVVAPLQAEQVQRTDERGRLTVRFPRSGRHLLATTVLTPPTEPGQPWTSRFATLGLGIAKR